MKRPDEPSPEEAQRHAARALELLKQIHGTHQTTGYFPTPDAVIARALDLLAVRPGERFVDLGCGDGRVLIAAAKRGWDATGCEADTRLAAHAAARVARVGPGRARVALGSFTHPGTLKLLGIDEAQAVFLFLQPWALDEVLPVLRARLPAGARVASYAFRPRLVRWRPAETHRVAGFDPSEDHRPLYIWHAPGPPRAAPKHAAPRPSARPRRPSASGAAGYGPGGRKGYGPKGGGYGPKGGGGGYGRG